MKELTSTVTAATLTEFPGCQHMDNSCLITSWVFVLLVFLWCSNSYRIYGESLFYYTACADLGSITNVLGHTKLVMGINFQLLPATPIFLWVLDLVWRLKNKYAINSISMALSTSDKFPFIPFSSYLTNMHRLPPINWILH